MKTVIRSLPGKITLFILCVLLLALSIACGIGACILAEEDFYLYDRQQLIETVQYNMIQSQVDDIVYYITVQRFTASDYAIYDPQRTNLRFLITSPIGIKIDSNVADTPNWTESVWRYRFHHVQQISSDITEEYQIYVYLEEGLPINDRYALATKLVGTLHDLRFWLLPLALGALLLSILCYICLLCAAARRPRSELLHPGALHRVPFDLLLAGSGAAAFLGILLLDNFYDGGIVSALLFLLYCLISVCGLLGLSMSLAARIKDRSLIKNTLVWRILTLGFKICRYLFFYLRELCNGLFRLMRSLPMIWRSALGVFIFLLCDFFLFVLVANGEGISVPLWCLRSLLLVLTVLYAALFMRKLQAGGRALAAGNLEHRVDTGNMFWDFREHGENLNRISQGMTVAVEQRLQSERMKTELITNVSHDIKTPLTSIINYSGLIAQEPCNCENHSAYADVLLRKSEHLKRLLDDLVEISRASSGNLDVVLGACDAGVLLNQISGEYQQRLQDANLDLILGIPEEPVQILADSRRIWRILENLMSNVCKYSLSGSRVFLTLVQEENTACIIIRNTSGTVLNVSAQELMERFVRGDSARTTEGNGLGLSIAQSLTQLQGGKMDVSIDADIFKVTLQFPLAGN